MFTLHDSIRKHLSLTLKQALLKLAPENTETEATIYNALVEPPNRELGHLAYGCFALAKALRKGPPQISAELAKIVVPDDVIESAQAVGPYLNFRIKSAALGKMVLETQLSGAYFKQTLFEKTPRTMLEYSQPNTHKELHVGHMRNMCLGASVINLLRYSGYPIIASTFPGDVGTHVAKCLWYMKYHNNEQPPADGKGEWLGTMYSKAHIKLEDELGTDKEAKNREQLTMILKQIEEKHGEFYDLWKETRTWSIDLMKRVYHWAGVKFDVWYWESDVDSDSVKYVKGLLADGKLTVSEGAVGMDLTEEKLGFCLLLKSDGNGLYATKDLELARRKFQDHKIEKSIYVVDVRQSLHFQQVFATLKRLGFSQAKQCYHLQYNFVELPDGAMSSRKGNIVPIMSLIHEMENNIRTQYLSRYESEWPKEEISKVASQVARGAIKYGMTRMDNNKKIVFDMKEWLRLDGESGPYVQYAAARINSLCKKMDYDASKKADWSLLNHKSEVELMVQLSQMNTLVASAADQYKPAVICAYLYDTARRFSGFYTECSIGQAETEELKIARLALSKATLEVLTHGLALLGIEAPERM